MTSNGSHYTNFTAKQTETNSASKSTAARGEKVEDRQFLAKL